jgi:hypothetical protein
MKWRLSSRLIKNQKPRLMGLLKDVIFYSLRRLLVGLFASFERIYRNNRGNPFPRKVTNRIPPG